MSELKSFFKLLPRKQFNILADSHIQFTGHIQQLLDSRLVKVALNWMPQGGRRPRGRPKMKCLTTAKELRKRSTYCFLAPKIAHGQSKWNKNKIVPLCSVTAGGTK